MERHAFHAMGTDVEVFLDIAPGPDAVLALASIEREFRRLDGVLSRFLPDSQLSRLNRSGTIQGGDDLLALIDLALAARERTGGRFDPTVHDALVAAGYDRSFELLDDDAGRVPAEPASAVGGRVVVRGRRIDLEPGARVDLGGIAKGYAVDRAVEWLAPVGPCLVNAGGDLRVAGVPEVGVWPVAVPLPTGSLILRLTDGALATSGRDRRRWRVGDEERHHLIDPRTGRPATSDLVTVTVAAPNAVEAEVWAKALFLAGEEEAVDEAEARGIRAVLVTADGRWRAAGGIA